MPVLKRFLESSRGKNVNRFLTSFPALSNLGCEALLESFFWPNFKNGYLNIQYLTLANVPKANTDKTRRAAERAEIPSSQEIGPVNRAAEKELSIRVP